MASFSPHMCFTSCLRTSHLYLPLSSISLFHLHCSCHSSLVGVKLMTVWVHYRLVFIIVQQSTLCRTCQSWSYTISLFMFQRSKKKKERRKKEKPRHEFHVSHLFVLLSLEFHIWKKRKHNITWSRNCQHTPDVHRAARFYPDFVSSNRLAEVQFHTPAGMLTSN